MSVQDFRDMNMVVFNSIVILKTKLGLSDACNVYCMTISTYMCKQNNDASPTTPGSFHMDPKGFIEFFLKGE